MNQTITYSLKRGNRLEQYQLQQLAKNIINHGEKVTIRHHSFVTNERGEIEKIKDGGKCIVVEGLGTKYWVHLSGLKVSEIIEIPLTTLSEKEVI